MVTEEELANMSPEEIAEFQKQNCVFCQISSGKIPAKTVFSDDEAVAVLDINPAANGHMLLMPKEHYSVMPQLPEQLVEHLFMICKGLSQAALKALQCKGTTIFVANGVAAGQKAPHFMIHIIPRSEDDGLSLKIPSNSFPKKELDVIRTTLTKAMNKKQKVQAEIVKETKTDKPKKATNVKKKKTYKKSRQKTEPKQKFDLDAIGSMLNK